MNINDFEKVEFLIKLKARLLKAISDCDDFLNEEPDVDVGGIPGFDTGFWCNITQHSDGSGPVIRMEGCYVQEQVIAATRCILANQLQDCLDALTNLGVEI